MQINRRAFVASLGGTAAVSLMTPDEKADALNKLAGLIAMILDPPAENVTPLHAEV